MGDYFRLINVLRNPYLFLSKCKGWCLVVVHFHIPPPPYAIGCGEGFSFVCFRDRIKLQIRSNSVDEICFLDQICLIIPLKHTQKNLATSQLSNPRTQWVAPSARIA